MIDLWALASALRLNLAKCIVISPGDVNPARRVLEDFQRSADAKVQGYGKYIGVIVGPEA